MTVPQVSRRQFVGSSAALLAMMGIGGCSSSSSDSGGSDTSSGIVLTDTLTILSLVQNDGFDPVDTANEADGVTMHSIYDNLFMYDAEGNPQPMLAESYEQDGNDITITLRSDVNFTDGNPVTANDVVFSFSLYADDEVWGPYIEQYITSIEKIDDSTILVRSARDDAIWMNILAGSVYILEAATYDKEANDYTEVAPTGSGAYIFESVDEARTVTLVANEDYWGGTPEFKTVIVKAPVQASTALVALQTGETNYATSIALSVVVAAKEDPNLEVITFDSWSQQLLAVLVGDQPFRKAIFHAINRQNILDICNNGDGNVATNLFSKKVMGDYLDSVEFEGYNLDLAKEYIAQTEVDLSQTFKISTYDAVDVAQCIQQDLAEIGINIEIDETDGNTWYQGVLDKSLEMFIEPLGNETLAPDSFEELLFGESSIYYFPVSDELKAAVADMIAIPNVSDRRNAVIDIMEMMVEEAPIVPLYDVNFFDVYTKGIGGTLPSSTATYAYYIGNFTNEQ